MGASKGKGKKSAPARTKEAEMNRLIELAYDEAERQIGEGTATSQVLTHFLKLGTTRNDLELRKLEQETNLLEAKQEALESSKDMKEMYGKALDAMRKYQGAMDEEVIDDEEL